MWKCQVKWSLAKYIQNPGALGIAWTRWSTISQKSCIEQRAYIINNNECNSVCPRTSLDTNSSEAITVVTHWIVSRFPSFSHARGAGQWTGGYLHCELLWETRRSTSLQLLRGTPWNSLPIMGKFRMQNGLTWWVPACTEGSTVRHRFPKDCHQVELFGRCYQALKQVLL